MQPNEQIYTNLEDIPSLKKDWIRLVHRCISKSLGKDTIQSIKENGLVFNRKSAEILPLQRGGCYDSPGYMVSSYNEELFWKKLEKDDFFVFDNAKYADTQIIFDMPLDEFCFLEKFGRIAIGKIDKKYIVGVIPNYNGYNQKITLPKEDILKAKNKSRQNPPSKVKPNSIDDMISKLQKRFSTISKDKINYIIETEKEEILYDINEELKKYANKTSYPINQLVYQKER